jgi:molybdenum cofactor cytidylyltransferase
MVRCAAILLAAGKSTRMGCLKALLPWQGTTLLEYQIAQLRQADIHSFIIVLGYHYEKLLPYIKVDWAHVVVNEDFEKGKTDSIKKGLLAMKAWHDCAIITAVDQPVNDQVMKALIRQFKQTKSKIIIPKYNGKRGHPILVSMELREELLQMKEETNGLKAVLHKWGNEICELEVRDPSILYNFNSPIDYRCVLKGEYSQ